MKIVGIICTPLLLLGAADSATAQALFAHMTVEELRQCGDLALSLQQQRDALAKRDLALNAQGRAIRAESDGVDKARRTVNIRDAKSIAAFNTRLTRVRQQAMGYQSAIANRNQFLQTMRLSVNQFNVLCVGRPYSVDLLAGLAPAQRAAMEQIKTEVSIPSILQADETPTSPPSAQGGGSRNGFVNLKPSPEPTPATGTGTSPAPTPVSAAAPPAPSTEGISTPAQ